MCRRLFLPALLFILLLTAPAVTAQDATPVATPVSDSTGAVLFVQSADASTLTPIDEAPSGATHELVLTAHIDPVVYFGDRPSRAVGTVPAGELLAEIDASSADPPNAALVARRADGTEEIVVLELLSGAANTEGDIVYLVRPLTDVADVDLGLAQAPSTELGTTRTYMGTHLFIDDLSTAPEGQAEASPLQPAVRVVVTPTEVSGGPGFFLDVSGTGYTPNGVVNLEADFSTGAGWSDAGHPTADSQGAFGPYRVNQVAAACSDWSNPATVVVKGWDQTTGWGAAWAVPLPCG